MNVRVLLTSLTVAGVLACGFAPTRATAAAADAYPTGCVSCHVVGKDQVDRRVGTMLKAWTAGKIDADLLAKTKASMPAGVAVKGKHPSADDSLEDVPGACLDCHGPDSKKAPSFARLMHLVHLTGAKNEFVTNHKGDCSTCHKLNVQNGEWTLPSAAEK
jgi:cytochrome c553